MKTQKQHSTAQQLYSLDNILKGSSYRLTQFTPSQIDALEKRITINEVGKKPAPYIECLVRNKSIKLTPEEAV